MGDFFKLFRSEAGKLKSSLADLRDRIEAKRRRREFLLTSPLPASDLAVMLAEYIDSMAARYPKALSRRLDFVRGMPAHAGNHLQSVQNPAVILFPGEGQNGSQAEHIAIALLYVFKAQIKKSLLEALEKEEIDPGPTRAERAAELPGLENDLQQLEEKRASLEAELGGLRAELGS